MELRALVGSPPLSSIIAAKQEMLNQSKRDKQAEEKKKQELKSKCVIPNLSTIAEHIEASQCLNIGGRNSIRHTGKNSANTNSVEKNPGKDTRHPSPAPSRLPTSGP